MITAEEVQSALAKLKGYLSEGYSIQLARKKACGYDNTVLSYLVRRQPEYIRVLNAYVARRTPGAVYSLQDGRVRCGKVKSINQVNRELPFGRR
ncbi:hypothetical protein D3C87_125480 [compost metagenome]